MEENLDKKNAQRQENNVPENPPTPVPSNAGAPESENQSTESMEVHHHSHAHGKRIWKSYVWEFVMLFLVVFCGFLAEYRPSPLTNSVVAS